MDRLTAALFSVEALIPLMLVGAIYMSAKWNWKARPYIPVLLGIVILAAGFGYHMWLTSTIDETRPWLSANLHKLNADELTFTRANIRSKELAAKVVELFTIPLAVSLIVAGLLAKADNEFARMVKRYEDYKGRVQHYEDQYRAAAEEFDKALDNNVRGATLIAQWKKLKILREDMIVERLEFRERFRPFRRSQEDN